MTDKIITYCHLNDNYVHGNVVTSPHGISKCLTSAMGAGGGAHTTHSIMRTSKKIVTPKTHDGLSCTITARQDGLGARNLVSPAHHPHGGGNLH